MVVPRHVLGGTGYTAPSDMLNVAIVGAGGMGGENAQQLGSEHIVAVCDVDLDFVARKVEERSVDGDGNPREQGVRWREQFTAARKYRDFREMLAEGDDIDAVLIATPDHTHAVIAAAAMRAGKHVYVQKPLAWSVEECRILDRIATETGVVTQMGNQGHSRDDARRINEWIQAGILGPVREVHVWTNRPIWPQGLPHPVHPPTERGPEADASWWPGDVAGRVAEAIGGDWTPPEGFDWELWRGPEAADVEYHPIFHPFHWRGWTAFGVGALGDMGAHLIDHPYWALDLGYPETIEATSTPWGGGSDDPATYPVAMKVHYRFPRRGIQPPVDMHWYDGGLMPQRPDVLPADVEFDRTGGVLYIGERGVMIHETYGANPTLYPTWLQAEADQVAESYPRIDGHEMNWVRACKGLEPASSPFSYAAPLTETMLLGLVALRTGQGRKIEYDGGAMQILNYEDANRWLSRTYRSGWEVR
jgi:predicted dehydrogenase